MRELCFENRDDIERVLGELNDDWSRTRVDDPNRVREMLERGGMLWNDAELLEQLTAPSSSTLTWGTGVNFKVGSEPVASVELWPLPYDFVDARPGNIDPGQEVPLRFRNNLRTSRRWLEPLFGFQDYLTITSMVRSVRQGGGLSINEDGVDRWLDAHHQTALYQNIHQH